MPGSTTSVTAEHNVSFRRAVAQLSLEFGSTFSIESIERFLTTSYDELADRSSITSFVPLLAERSTRQRLRTLANLKANAADGYPTVLFLADNIGQALMAASWYLHRAGLLAIASFCDSEPESAVEFNLVAAVMAEIGIDVASEAPQPWTADLVQVADVIVTLGCVDVALRHPGKRYEEWRIDVPPGDELTALRETRDEIGRRVETLVHRLRQIAS